MRYKVGDHVSQINNPKVTRLYELFDGYVVAAFLRLSGEQRYVVEDLRGVLSIFREEQLERMRGPHKFAAELPAPPAIDPIFTAGGKRIS